MGFVVNAIIRQICFCFTRRHCLRSAGVRSDSWRSGQIAALLSVQLPASTLYRGGFYCAVRRAGSCLAAVVERPCWFDCAWWRGSGALAELDAVRSPKRHRMWFWRTDVAGEGCRLAGNAVAVAVHGDRNLYQQGLCLPWPVVGQLVGNFLFGTICNVAWLVLSPFPALAGHQCRVCGCLPSSSVSVVGASGIEAAEVWRDNMRQPCALR